MHFRGKAFNNIPRTINVHCQAAFTGIIYSLITAKLHMSESLTDSGLYFNISEWCGHDFDDTTFFLKFERLFWRKHNLVRRGREVGFHGRVDKIHIK